MKIFTIFLALLLAACGPSATKERTKTLNICSESNAGERAEFILRCIEAGNPKSDEEPEDWIGMCQDMAEDTLCGKGRFIITLRSESGVWREISRRAVEGK